MINGAAAVSHCDHSRHCQSGGAASHYAVQLDQLQRLVGRDGTTSQ